MSSLLLSFAWAVPLSREQCTSIFDRGIESGLLSEMDGEFGAAWVCAEDFLAHYTAKPVRRLLSGDPLSIRLCETTLPCRVIVTWHPAYHSMTFIVTASIDAGPDVAIAVLQSLQGRVSEDALRGSYRGETHSSVKDSVTAAFTELTAGNETGELHRKGWVVEVRDYDGHPPGRAVDADPRPFYGLATSDEGWRFVPPEVAREALGQQWGTRTFVAAYAMANSIVCLNSKGTEYTEHQRELALNLFGETEPYFEIDSPVGGLDHGMLFILERVLIRMALADQWLYRAQLELAQSDEGKTAANRKRRLLRGSLDDLLEMLNSVLPPEIDSLERRLVTTMGVERVIQQLDRQAEAMDDETRYSYESVVSARVTRLTVVTVILTVVTIILGVLQVLVSI